MVVASSKVWTVVIVKRRDRQGCMNTEKTEAALAAYGRKLVVFDEVGS